MTSYILLLQVYMAWQEHTVKCTVQISILRTRLNHLARLAKWLSVYLRTKWFWVRSLLQYLNFKCHASFEQGVPWHSGNYTIECGFTLKCIRDIAYYLARDSGFNIQDSGFQIKGWKRKVWKYISRNKFQVLEYQICVHNSPIIKLLFQTKICALIRRGFPRKFSKRGLLYIRCPWGQNYKTK